MEPSSASGMVSATGETGRSTIFVSYSRDDLDFADQLAAGLRLCGFTPTVDRHAISGGEDWQARLRALILEADTVVFVLSPKSARSEICAWEVAEASRLGKCIVPVVPRPLDGAAAPARLQDLNYIFFYAEPRSPGTGFGSGLATLVTALQTDLGWLREHTRLLERAIEWEAVGRPSIRLLSGTDIASAKSWAAAKPRGAPEPTALHLDYIRASEDEETSRAGAERQRLAEIAAAQDARASALKATEQALRDKAEAQQALRERDEAALRRSRFNTTVAVLVALGAIALAGFYIRQASSLQRANQLATHNAVRAAIAQRDAEDAAYDATVNRSRALIQAARGQVQAGNHWNGVKLAIEALDVDKARIGGRKFYLPEANKILAMQSLKQQLIGHQDSVISIAVSGDGNTVVTGSRDKTALVWRPVRSGLLGAPVSLSHPAEITSVAVTPDGRTIATTANDSVRIFDVAGFSETREPKRAIQRAELKLTAVAVSLDGSQVAFGATNGWAGVAEIATGAIVWSSVHSKFPVAGLAFTPDGTRVIIGAQVSARIVEARTGLVLRELPSLHTAGVTSVAVSRDGAKIATGSADATARIWDASTGEALAVLQHVAPVLSLAFLPDGRLVTGSGHGANDRPIDSTLRLWTSEGGSHRVIGGHFSAVRSVAASSDGERIYSAADFGSLGVVGARDAKVGRAWVWGVGAVQSDDAVAQARRSIPSCLGPAERADFGLSPLPPAWCIEAAKRPYDGPSWRTPDARDPAIARDYATAFEVAVCNLNYKDADVAAKEAIRRQPDLHINKLMGAMADMVNGRTASARQQFHTIRQLAVPRGEGLRVETWEEGTLLVFRYLRACGITDPLMDEIEQAFASPAKQP